MFTLEHYLNYISVTIQPEKPVSVELLKEIITAHLTKFSYQNMDIFMQGLLEVNQRKICDISPGAIFKQFITNNCSGYCFQNAELLAWALQQLGFKITRRLAKVINQFEETIDEKLIENSEYSHEVLVVELDNQQWLVDTAFANNSLRLPLKLAVGEQGCADDQYNLTINNKTIRLAMLINNNWFCLYDVDKNLKSIIDIHEANHNLFASTNKIPIRDDFVKLAIVTPQKRKILCGFKDSNSGFFKSYSNEHTKKESEITSSEQFKNLAKKKFDISIDEKIIQSIFSS